MVLLAEKTPILVVDDVLAQRRVIAERLKHEGYDVMEAHNAATAIQAFTEVPHLRLALHDLALGLNGGTAKDVHRAVRHLLEKRGGVFVVVTSMDLTVMPWKMRAQDLRDVGVPVFQRPIPWDDILPLFEAARASEARQTA